MKRLFTLVTILLLGATSQLTYAQCNANFGYRYTSSDSTTVVFWDSMSSWSYNHWNFGDGTTYNGQTPVTHQYKNKGTYYVCHVVMDSARTCLDSFCTNIVIPNSRTSCKADFKFTVRGDTVDFESTSSNAAYYYWNWGSSTAITTKKFTHVFNTGGQPQTYAVNLIITDSSRSCSDSITKYITIGNSTRCQAYFYYSVSNDTVVFTNQSSVFSNRVGYAWSFGDGTSSTQKHPTHIYRYGSYVACLTITDSVNNCTSTMCDSVVVDTVKSSKCKADFTSAQQRGYVYFSNRSKGGVKYLWTFGDGDSSTATSPTHQYSKAGNYTVCLYIWDNAGCSDSVCKTVKIDSNYCKPSFRVAIDTSAKYKVYLINSSSNLSSHQYYWTFGDGTTSTKRNPTHKYSTYGLYNVCLTITDSVYQCSTTYCDSLGMDSLGRLLKAQGFDLEVIEDDFSSVTTPKLAVGVCYPNPTSHKLNIKLENMDSRVTVQIFSTNGVLVREVEDFEYHNNSLDVSDLVDGLYLMNVSDGANLARLRFVKGD